MSRVVIIEDQKVLLDALKLYVEEGSRHEVCGTFTDPEQALEYIEKHPDVDLVITDIRLPKFSGIDLSKKLKQLHPKIKIILLTQFSSSEFIQQGINSGASGYLLKGVSGEELIKAINTILDGQQYFCNDTSKILARRLKNETLNMNLTAREVEVIKLLAEGKSTKEMGDMLAIEPTTIQYHKRNIKEKLNLSSTHEIIKYAFNNGMTTPL